VSKKRAFRIYKVFGTVWFQCGATILVTTLHRKSPLMQTEDRKGAIISGRDIFNGSNRIVQSLHSGGVTNILFFFIPVMLLRLWHLSLK